MERYGFSPGGCEHLRPRDITSACDDSARYAWKTPRSLFSRQTWDNSPMMLGPMTRSPSCTCKKLNQPSQQKSYEDPASQILSDSTTITSDEAQMSAAQINGCRLRSPGCIVPACVRRPLPMFPQIERRTFIGKFFFPQERPNKPDHVPLWWRPSTSPKTSSNEI